MKNDNPANSRSWNTRHGLLRRALMKDHDYKKALPLFLDQHAAIHSARLQPGPHWSYQDEVLGGLREAQLRLIPRGSPHSAVWSLWHITRIEDVTVNLLLAGAAQVLHTGGWLDRLKVCYEGVGNELSGVEIAEVSRTVDVKALLAYRLAVGKRTCAVVRRLDPEVLWVAPGRDRMGHLLTEKAVDSKLGWLLKYWGGHPAANLLMMPAARHGFVHLNEIQRMLPKLRRLKLD